MTYELYMVDTETTGLDPAINDPIEISIYRLSNDTQKTWLLKPINKDAIDPGALRVNGHKLEDLLGQTLEGREKYLDPNKVIVDIENWIADDNVSSSDRLLVGHNVGFDKLMLIHLWKKLNSFGTFVFNEKYSIDTMIIEFVMDHCKGEYAKGYNLKSLTKKYGVSNDKAHSAASDTLATVGVFRKQINMLKKALLK
jgi:DNA polymerase III epsilon subunit-like protein